MTCELSLPYSKVKRAAVPSEAGSSVLAPQPLTLAPAALLPSLAVSLHLGHLCAHGWADPILATPVSCPPSIHRPCPRAQLPTQRCWPCCSCCSSHMNL